MSFEGNHYAALKRIVKVEDERDAALSAIRASDGCYTDDEIDRDPTLAGQLLRDRRILLALLDAALAAQLKEVMEQLTAQLKEVMEQLNEAMTNEGRKDCRIDNLEKALQKFGSHTRSCKAWGRPRPDLCTCGYVAAFGGVNAFNQVAEDALVAMEVKS